MKHSTTAVAEHEHAEPDTRIRLRASHTTMPSPPDEFFTVHVGDARRIDFMLGQFSAPDVPLLTTTITSPPYGSLKDYGHIHQIGYGQAEDEYRIDLRRIFRSLFTHTRPEGSLWLVLDTLRPRQDDAQVRELRLLPFELAREAQIVGWHLRDVIIWEKDKARPWSSRGRLRNAFEYVLFFVKTKKFKYHIDRLRESVDLEKWWVRYPERYNPQGKAPSNVWHVPIPVQGSWANTTIQHACPLPPDLAERLILLSTDDGDVVFDPFAGSGVVVAEAERLQRRGLGIELVDEYVAAFHATVRPEITQRRGLDVLAARLKHQAWLRQTILGLRVVKYPRVLMEQLAKHYQDLPAPTLAFAIKVPSHSKGLLPHEVVRAKTILLVDSSEKERQLIAEAARTVSLRQPLSKFGLGGEITVAPPATAGQFMRGRTFFLYRNGRTWASTGLVRARHLETLLTKSTGDRVPPILSNVFVDEIPRALRGDAEISLPS